MLASYCLRYYLRGWGIVDERRTERRQTGWQGTRPTSRENLAVLLVPQKLFRLPGGCFVLRFACYFPRFLVLRCLYAVMQWCCFFSSFQVSAMCNPLRGDTTFFFSLFFSIFLFRFDSSVFCFLFYCLFILCSLFHRTCMS